MALENKGTIEYSIGRIKVSRWTTYVRDGKIQNVQKNPKTNPKNFQNSQHVSVQFDVV